MQKLLIQRPETDRTFPQIVQLQKYYRQSLPPDSLRAAMQEALGEMATQMGFASRPHQPAPTPPKKARPKSPASPRVKCETHFEKKFVFSDGTVWQCCTHDECLFGKGRKTHSDRLPHSLIEVEDEQEQSDVQELSFDTPIPIAGDDGDENDDSESDSESDIESVESVESEEDEALAAYSNRNGGDGEC